VAVTDGSGRISYLNRVAEELTGWEAEDALGKPSTELLRFRHRSGRPVEDLVPVVMLQGTPAPLPADIWLEGPGRRRYAIEGSLAPRWKEGRSEGVVITFKDVTLRRFEDEQSRQDSKHDALSRLADGIAGHLDLELSVVADESSRLLQSLPSESTLRATAESGPSTGSVGCSSAFPPVPALLPPSAAARRRRTSSSTSFRPTPAI
jgi:PAS domain S-box-containing protein